MIGSVVNPQRGHECSRAYSGLSQLHSLHTVLLYAEQAQYHDLQVVDTRRHALQDPTVVARFKLQNTYI